MEKLLFGTFDFIAGHKWVQYLLLALAIIATLGTYLLMRDNGVRQKERDRWLKEQAKEAAKIETTRREITEDQRRDEIRADEAVRNMPDVGSLSELRELDPAVAAELLGPATRSPR